MDDGFAEAVGNTSKHKSTKRCRSKLPHSTFFSPPRTTFYTTPPPKTPVSMKSVTQTRLDQHEDRFERVLTELQKSKEVGSQGLNHLKENIGELKYEFEALESTQRDTRLVAERNKDALEDQGEQLGNLSKAYTSLSSVMTEEIDRIRSDHGNQLTSLGTSISDVQRSGTTTNSRLNDVLAEQSTLRTRVEDDVERMRGQLRQQRVEFDDIRRQTSCIGDLQTVLSELNSNQQELAIAVSGLQQSSIYISEWVQTLRSEAAELRSACASVQTEQVRSSRALASDVNVLAEDIAGLRSRITHQDSELSQTRENIAGRVEAVAASVTRAVDAERKEVQTVLESVKVGMSRQDDHTTHVMGTLHTGQQRLQAQFSETMQNQAEKNRAMEHLVQKLDTNLTLKTSEMSRGLEDHVNSIKRHLDANDQSVKLVTDMLSGQLRSQAVPPPKPVGTAWLEEDRYKV